ncbi:MAG: flagellar basal body rod protein FlgC [Solirubrobacteraceae bacterium]
MGLFDAIEIAGSGMNAERTAMDITAENLANAQSTSTASGQPYQRQEVVLEETSGGGFQQALAGAMSNSGASSSDSGPVVGGVEVAGIVNDTTPDQLVYDPGNPSANKQGYVQMPNVNPVTEMVNLIDESNSYQSDVTAMQTAKDMFTSTLDVLKQ